jgi:hypothetical protein
VSGVAARSALLASESSGSLLRTLPLAATVGPKLLALYIPMRGTSLAFRLQRHWDAFPGLLEKA